MMTLAELPFIAYVETLRSSYLFNDRIDPQRLVIQRMQMERTHLQEGEFAPEFALPDQNRQPHDLKDFRGQRVLLYFYGEDDTAG